MQQECRWQRWAWWIVVLFVLSVGTTYATALFARHAPYRVNDYHVYHFWQDGHWRKVSQTTIGWQHLIMWGAHERPVDANIEESRQFLLEREWIKSSAEPTIFGTVNTHYIGVEPPTMGFREFIQSEILDGPVRRYVEDGTQMVYLDTHGIEIAAGWPMRGLKGASVGLFGGPPIAVRGAIYLGRGPYDRIVPLIPVFPDFVVNVLFFMGLWAGAIFGGPAGLRAISHRRRRKRGLCPMCRYDLAGAFDSGCPECGWNRLKS